MYIGLKENTEKKSGSSLISSYYIVPIYSASALYINKYYKGGTKNVPSSKMSHSVGSSCFILCN